MDESEYSALYRLEERHWWFKSMRQLCDALLGGRLNFSNNSLILDIGCGTGFGTQHLKKYGRVIGLDASVSAVKFSKQRGIIVVLGSANALPFKKNIFGVVTCFEVLHHQLVDPVQAVLEVERVSTGNALFMFRVSAYQWLYGLHDHAVHTAKRFTSWEVRRFMRTTKFVECRVSYVCCFMFPLLLVKRLFDVVRSGKRKSELDQTNYASIFFLLLMKLEILFLRCINLPFGIQVLGFFKKN